MLGPRSLRLRVEGGGCAFSAYARVPHRSPSSAGAAALGRPRAAVLVIELARAAPAIAAEDVLSELSSVDEIQTRVRRPAASWTARFAAPTNSSYVRLTPEIIEGMQQLALEQRRLLGPRAPWHVGDVAWGLRQHEGREPEWTFRLWREGDRVVAWSWLKRDRGLLEYDLHPGHRHLLEEIVDQPDAKEAIAFEDDDEARAILARHGFTKPTRAIHFNHRDVPEAPTPPHLPDGFRYRTVDPEDLAERVAIHRDVWEPSHVTESSYRNVMAEWPYRGSLDCVVEAPDGRFASYVLVWPDDENGVGLFEPVGTRAEFRRRGLGAAVCTFGLRRLHEEGMRRAVVGCDTEPACALYESLGFGRSWTITSYAR